MSWAINDVVLREDGFSIYAEQKVDVSEVSLILQGIFLLWMLACFAAWR